MLWDCICVHVVAWGTNHFSVFSHHIASGSGFVGFISLKDLGHQLWILHDDAASCGLGYLATHAGKEFGLCIEYSHVAGVGVEEIGCHLDDGTKFEGAGR